MSLDYTLHRLEELTPREIHEIFRLRVDVFVVEQECAYPEIDDKDLHALHLRHIVDGEVAAYARVFLDDDDVIIGRVIVAPHHRGSGLGHDLVSAAVETATRTFPGVPVSLNAQSHLVDFYASHGFSPSGEEF